MKTRHETDSFYREHCYFFASLFFIFCWFTIDSFFNYVVFFPITHGLGPRKEATPQADIINDSATL